MSIPPYGVHLYESSVSQQKANWTSLELYLDGYTEAAEQIEFSDLELFKVIYPYFGTKSNFRRKMALFIGNMKKTCDEEEGKFAAALGRQGCFISCDMPACAGAGIFGANFFILGEKKNILYLNHHADRSNQNIMIKHKHSEVNLCTHTYIQRSSAKCKLCKRSWNCTKNNYIL